MYKSQVKINFKSQFSQEQRTAMKVTKEFEKRKERISNSTSGYQQKIKTVPDFELEHYDCGDSLEVLVKKMSHISYNVFQMCTEVFNGTPGTDLKDRVRRIVAKLWMEYGDNSKELTERMEDMMTELATYNIDTKLGQTFLTVMLNVINVLHKKRDAETDEFMEEVEAEEEEKEIKKASYLVNSQRKGTLGPRKPKADEILPKKKTDEIVPKKKSVLNYNSSDSEDTMRSKIPMKLEIDHNNIMKLKQRILVWAAQQSGYNTNDIPIKLLLKNLDQIYSGSYRALVTVSVEEARQIDLPPWLTTRLKDNTTDIPVQQDNLQLSKGSPSKASPYKIARK
jgi:hypothetical protein